MILTGGVFAELGNSALVGRPVGIDVGIMAIGEDPGRLPTACGTFHNGA